MGFARGGAGINSFTDTINFIFCSFTVCWYHYHLPGSVVSSTHYHWLILPRCDHKWPPQVAWSCSWLPSPSHSLQHFLGRGGRGRHLWAPHRPLWNCLKLTQHVTTPSCHHGASRAGHSDIIPDQTQHPWWLMWFWCWSILKLTSALKLCLWDSLHQTAFAAPETQILLLQYLNVFINSLFRDLCVNQVEK